jgi:hypothetical protein
MTCSSLEISVYAIEIDVSLIMVMYAKQYHFTVEEFNFNPCMISFPILLMIQNYLSIPSVAKILHEGFSISTVP